MRSHVKSSYSAEEKFVLLDKLLTGETTWTSLIRHDGMPVPQNTVRYWLEVAAKRLGVNQDPAWPALRAAKLGYTLPDDGTSGVAIVDLQKRFKDSLNEEALTSFKAESLVKGGETQPKPERHVTRDDLNLVEQNKFLQDQILTLEESIRQKNEIRDALEQEVRDLTRMSKFDQATMAKMAKELDELRGNQATPCEVCATYQKQVMQLKGKLSLREQQVLTMLDRILVREED